MHPHSALACLGASATPHLIPNDSKPSLRNEATNGEIDCGKTRKKDAENRKMEREREMGTITETNKRDIKR